MFGGLNIDESKLDEYLNFCKTIMKDVPLHHGICGIWLRGSPMYKENAIKLLKFYDYNYDLAKFHALYPMIMNDPQKRYTIV